MPRQLYILLPTPLLLSSSSIASALNSGPTTTTSYNFIQPWRWGHLTQTTSLSSGLGTDTIATISSTTPSTTRPITETIVGSETSTSMMMITSSPFPFPEIVPVLETTAAKVSTSVEVITPTTSTSETSSTLIIESSSISVPGSISSYAAPTSLPMAPFANSGRVNMYLEWSMVFVAVLVSLGGLYWYG